MKKVVHIKAHVRKLKNGLVNLLNIYLKDKVI